MGEVETAPVTIRGKDTVIIMVLEDPVRHVSRYLACQYIPQQGWQIRERLRRELAHGGGLCLQKECGGDCACYDISGWRAAEGNPFVVYGGRCYTRGENKGRPNLGKARFANAFHALDEAYQFMEQKVTEYAREHGAQILRVDPAPEGGSHGD